MNSNKTAQLRHHLRHNHYPPATFTFIRTVQAVLEAVEDGRLHMEDTATVEIDGGRATVRDGERPVTVRELVDSFRLEGFVERDPAMY